MCDGSESEAFQMTLAFLGSSQTQQGLAHSEPPVIFCPFGSMTLGFEISTCLHVATFMDLGLGLVILFCSWGAG